MKLTKEQQKIHNKRTHEYGSNGVTNLQNVGLMWTGILQCYFQNKLPGEIPTHIVSLMMAAVKISRVAQGIYKEDNYADAVIYLHIAEKGQPK